MYVVLNGQSVKSQVSSFDSRTGLGIRDDVTQKLARPCRCRGHKEGLTLPSSDQSPTQVMGQYSDASTLRIGEPSTQKPGSSHRAGGGQRRRHHSGTAPGSAGEKTTKGSRD
jgi:hypothetical protein